MASPTPPASPAAPASHAADAIRTASSHVKLVGFLLIVAGMLAIFSPYVAGKAIAYLVGALVLVSGIAEIFWAAKTGSAGHRILGVLLGLLMIVGGVAMLSHPALNLLSLTLLVAIYFGVVGIAEIVAGFRMGSIPGRGFVIFNGVVSLLLGMLIWSEWPLSGTWAIGVLVGVHLLMHGMQLVSIGSAGKALASRA